MLSMRRISAVACTLFLATQAAPLLAKGLDELSQANPDNEQEEKPADGEEAKPAVTPADGEGEPPAEGEGEAEAKPEMVRSAASLAIADKLYVGTSFGRVKASSSKGTWNSSGMSDVAVGYRLPFLISPTMGLFATYRYAPMAVTWEVDAHSLRGTLEAHYLGGRLNYKVSPNLVALSTLELGYVSVHMHATDSLGVPQKYNAGGMSVALGGGADWQFGDKANWSAGPRVNLGFGAFSTAQFGGALGFMF